MSSSLEQQIQFDRDMSRANWRRGIGAVVFRELTEEAFLAGPNSDRLDLELLQQEMKAKRIDVATGDLGPLWISAYTVSDVAIRGVMHGVRKRAVSLIDDRDAPLGRFAKDLNKYVFWNSANTALEEAGATMAHFPISLVRTISTFAASHSPALDGVERFMPKRLNDVADLLESPDVQTMFDQALLPANGFWADFSTNVVNFRRTNLASVTPYSFTDGKVAFSDQALHLMRRSIRVANRSPDLGETSSSGCPARHAKINPRHITDMEYLRELSVVFGKTPEELLAPREQNVAQAGLRCVIAALRAGDQVVRQYQDRLNKTAKRRRTSNVSFS